jgi:hypothetical protein
MMRTIEILLVIIVITGAFIIASLFAVLPSPRQVSPLNLRRLALTTLQTLDTDYDLSKVMFKPSDDSGWGELQVALSACLPPSIVYNLTVYEVQNNNTQLYNPIMSISNAANLGISSDASSYLVASSNVTFSVTPEKVGERGGGGGTLYVLNCSDANGWWITGYTSQSLAEDLYRLLSPYFKTTVMVQNTAQLGLILNGTSLQGETVQNAVIVNTFGEAVPIPSGYYASSTVGYDSSHSSYARYCYTLGKRVLQYNWTWASIVGYPLYYVGNTGLFPNDQNTWGIYGMRAVGAAGLNAFLRGLDNQSYSYDDTWITAELAGVVYLSNQAKYYSNYYGIYPSPYQTATRALPSSITSTYHLTPTTYIFNPVGNYNPGTVYRHTVTVSGTTQFKGSLLALGLTRTPDIRLTALGILSDYKPRLYRSEYTATGTSRLVVLQLGETGGI